MPKERKAHEDVLDPARYDSVTGDLDDNCQLTVWEPDEDNRVHIWFEDADGEASFELNPDERRRLILHLQRGLD